MNQIYKSVWKRSNCHQHCQAFLVNYRDQMKNSSIRNYFKSGISGHFYSIIILLKSVFKMESYKPLCGTRDNQTIIIKITYQADNKLIGEHTPSPYSMFSNVAKAISGMPQVAQQNHKKRSLNIIPIENYKVLFRCSDLRLIEIKCKTTCKYSSQ